MKLEKKHKKTKNLHSGSMFPSFKTSSNPSKSPKKGNKTSDTFFHLTSRIEHHFQDLSEIHTKSRSKFKLSKPIETKYIKTEPSLLNSFLYPEKTREGLAKYNLICFQPIESWDPSKTFTSFNDILTNNKEWTKDFQEPFSETNMVSQQLYYNVRQKALLERSQNDYLKRTYTTLYGDFMVNHRKMLEESKKIKIITNEKDKDNKTVLAVKKLIENTKKEENEKLESSTQPIKLKKIHNVASYEHLENLNLHFKFYWYKVPNHEWKPENREGASLTYINGKLYLYGGKARRLHSEIVQLDPKKWNWEKVDLPQNFQPRLGHSAVCYKNHLVIYGGEYLYNDHLKIRDCLGDVKIIDFETKECKTLRTYGDFIENRRNHAYCLFSGKFLFISGGINSNGRFLNDLMYLNLETFKWSIGICETQLESLAFHTMIAVYKTENKNIIDVYKAFDIDLKSKTNSLNKIKEEGIYLFGGMNEQQVVFNQLKVLKLGSYPLKWIEPETRGIPPQPRYLHSMNYFQDLNIIIIYGGRNDKNSQPILSDICILNVFNLCWSKVSLNGLGYVPKCSHCTAIVDSKLIVFGGYTLNEYVSADVYILELNQDLVKNLIAKNKFLQPDKETNNFDDIEENKQNNEIKREQTIFLRGIRSHKISTYLPIPGERNQRKHEKSYKI